MREQRAHSPGSSQRGEREGRTHARTHGRTEGASGGSYAAFSHKYTRIAGRMCADERGAVFRMDAFVRAPPPVQHPAGHRMEAGLPK